MRGEFSNDRVPLAYLITFRSYGTWLHGRSGSVDRFHNHYGERKLAGNLKRQQYISRLLKQASVRLDKRRRQLVARAITETCEIRGWNLWTMNVRTNHIHVVVSALRNPKAVMSAFKANATRLMRMNGMWNSNRSPWAEGGSTKYLWTETALSNAIAYVMYDQGEPLD